MIHVVIMLQYNMKGYRVFLLKNLCYSLPVWSYIMHVFKCGLAVHSKINIGGDNLANFWKLYIFPEK